MLTLQDSLSLSKTLKQVSMLGSPALETKEYKYLTGEEERDLGLLLEYLFRGGGGCVISSFSPLEFQWNNVLAWTMLSHYSIFLEFDQQLPSNTSKRH